MVSRAAIMPGPEARSDGLQEVVERCRAVMATPVGEVAAAWKSAHAGAKVVGCFPVYTPVELIHASGALPLGVIGGGNQIEIAHADSRFQSFICSIVKSTLELGLTARLDALDALVFHSICDPARNLASVYKRNFPGQRVEYLHLPQNLASQRAEDYLTAEYARLLDSLLELTGRPRSQVDLAASLEAYNRSRELVRALYRARRDWPERLSAADSYALVRAGTLLPVAEHVALLQRALAAVEARVARPLDRIRVVLEGAFCEQPPLELIERLEEAGCYLVDDDFLLGWRFFEGDVPTGPDPLRSLASAYLHQSVYSGVKHDVREPKARHLLDKVRETRADAVVILVAKFCEPALFDYALYRRALDQAGIPHLFLEFEEKAWVFDRLRGEVETFVESMLFQ
jgi:benzoyl-CoA reductase subunit C